MSLLYSRISSSVLVNGELSLPFQVSQDVRHGCPLSPLLYIIFAETTACAIRADLSIHGYPISNICQHADDTRNIVLSDLSMKAVFALFHRYELASGACLNVEKSLGLLVGSWEDRTDLPIQLDWSSTHITVMGSRLSNDGEESYEKGIRSLDSLLATWSTRSLSSHSRALIANTLGLSLFWYLASFTHLPPIIVKAINQRVFSFIWQKKREWLARSSVTHRSPHGGLGLVDIPRKIQSLHVVWIK